MSLNIDTSKSFTSNYGSINSDPTTGLTPAYSSLASLGVTFAQSKEITFSAKEIPTSPSAWGVFCANLKKAIPGFVVIAIICLAVALTGNPGGAIVLAFMLTSLLLLICALRTTYQFYQQNKAIEEAAK